MRYCREKWRNIPLFEDCIPINYIIDTNFCQATVKTLKNFYVLHKNVINNNVLLVKNPLAKAFFRFCEGIFSLF